MDKVEWFYRPKVQFGFWVNLIFVLYTLMVQVDPYRPQYWLGDRAKPPHGEGSYQLPAATAPQYATLPPPAAETTSRTTVIDLGGGLAHVILNSDMTLVRRPGRTLLLSPSFNVGTRPYDPPSKVTLSFSFFTEKDACTGACMFAVNADGARVFESEAKGASSSSWTHTKYPAPNSQSADSTAVPTLAYETFSTDIPYATFLKIIVAKRVALRFGPDKVELTHEQLEALRDMHRSVKPPADVGRVPIINAF